MLNTAKLKEEQIKLAKEVIVRDDFEKITYFGGCDQAFIGDEVVSGIVVLDKDMKLIENKYSKVKAAMSYVPGFLFYREGPAIIEAFNKLEQKPDVLMVDGSGILHPRRIGIASQLGIILNIPTIGVTKKLNCGNVKEGKVYYDKEIRGIELKTREFAKPIYASPGHKISLGKSLEIVKSYLKPPHKLPEPIHQAHKYVNKVRDQILNKGEKK